MMNNNFQFNDDVNDDANFHFTENSEESVKKISNKTVYSFQEISTIAGLKPYVMRFWESEFTEISPEIKSNGDKIYSKNDLNLFLKIKELLFSDKLSISQAKGYLANFAAQNDEMLLKDDNQPVAFVTLEERAQDLKQSLEIGSEQTKGTLADNSSQEFPMALALNVIKNVTEKVSDQKMSDRLSDSQIVKLVSAKKKLKLILNKISDLQRI